MKSYQKFLETVQTPGQPVSAVRKPVFRSSGIFPVKQAPGFWSRVSLLGYWVVKRDIKEVTVLYTLRDNEGALVLRESFLIEAPRVYDLEIALLLEKAGRDTSAFEGSLEVEVFSTRNLIFTYPAIVLCYYGETFSTSVHTAGRIYNDIEDMRDNEECPVAESGFDIYPGKDLRPFFAFTNGPAEDAEASMGYVVYDADGKTLEGKFSLGPLKPYQTIFLELKEHVALDKFLGDRPGTIKLHHNLKGIFPRLVCGNFGDRTAGASITHSYYDCSGASAGSDYWKEKDPSIHDAAILMPLFLTTQSYTDLVLYPLYSPGNLTLRLDFHGADGALLASLPEFRKLDTALTVFERLSLGEAASKAGLEPSRVSGVNLLFRSEGPVPTRIKMGFNVGQKKAILPCNICFAPKVGDPDAKKNRSYHWAPLLNVGRSVLALTNGSPQKNYTRRADVRLRFYRQQDTSVLERSAEIAANGQWRLDVSQDKELSGFFDGKTGWATFESENPYVYGWYFDFHVSGAVAGDHAF